MNQSNFDYLKDQIKYTGFGETLESSLMSQIKEGKDNFTLQHQHTFGNEKTEAALHFRKSDQGMYFFNSYDLMVGKGSENEIKQRIYVDNDSRKKSQDQAENLKAPNNTITQKEAYNLLKGRAVHKTLSNKQGDAYNAWVQLNFKETDKNGNYKLNQFHENYGYKLEDALQKHPIKELQNESDKKNLMDSLKKGNRQAVTFEIEGKEQRRFIEAKPQFKSINIYDENGKRQRPAQKQKEQREQKQERSQKNKVKKEDESPDGKVARKRSRKKSQGIA